MKAIMKINMNEMRSDVMNLAWNFARVAANKFGGTAREYVNACVRRAWHVVKRDYERVSNEIFLATVCKLYEEDNNNTMSFNRIYALLQNQNDITMHMGVNSYFHGYVACIIQKTICTLDKNVNFVVKTPLEIRKALIDCGIESWSVIKQCVNSSAFVYCDTCEYDEMFRQSIYSHIEKCIDATKGISRMYDTVEMLRNYVETKRAYNEITEYEMYEFKKFIDNYAHWKTKGRF